MFWRSTVSALGTLLHYIGPEIYKDTFSLYSYINRFEYFLFAGLEIPKWFSIQTFSTMLFSTFDEMTMLSLEANVPNTLQGAWLDGTGHPVTFHIILSPLDEAFQATPLDPHINVSTYVKHHIISMSQSCSLFNILGQVFVLEENPEKTLQFVEFDHGYAIKIVEGKDQMFLQFYAQDVLTAANGILVILHSTASL